MPPLLLVLLFVLLSWQVAPAAAERPSDSKTYSPYFFVKTDDPSTDRLPLKATAARVDIAGMIARVKVTQVYRNEGRHALEAIYVFPASTRAAVHGMKMTIGERVITARIEERQEARRHYQQALDAGQSASLLEQQRPNVFQMNVGNILPGDEIKVELVYSELLVPERRRLRIRLSHRRRAPLLDQAGRVGAGVRALGGEPLPPTHRPAGHALRVQREHQRRDAAEAGLVPVAHPPG